MNVTRTPPLCTGLRLHFVNLMHATPQDEPTSGMDPYSRRFTWEVIRRHRAAAAIVLTTHSMEVRAEGAAGREGEGLLS